MDCSKITSGLQAVICDKPAIPGTGEKVYIINYNDIDRELSVIANNVITDIILKGNATGYLFESLDNSTEGTTTLNKGKYISNWQQNLSIRIFAKNESAKAFVNELNGARVVAIIENKESGDSGEVKYEAYGWDAGLELNEVTAETIMTDYVVYSLTLGSGEISKESTLPKSVFKTDLASTETMLEALLPTTP